MAAPTSNYDKLIRSDWVFRAVPSSFNFLVWSDALNAQNAPSAIYAGVFASLIAPLVWMLAVQQLGPNRTSIFMNLVPVFTAIIASIWLSEQWTIYHTFGGIMILVGIIMAQKEG